MTKKRILTLLAFVPFCVALAQTDLYMPVEFRKAYENGTRSWDGKVGANYWQNRSIYKLKATIDPATRLLKGEAEITYFNNSPDSIRNPVFHAYHDFYKPNSKKAGFFAGGHGSEDPHAGMVIESLKVNGEVVDLKDRNQAIYRGTNYQVRLKKPLPPGASMKLEFKWNYVIPGEGFERSGAIDPTSFFVAYWYPEMSVLDDVDSWDRVVYDAATEFYHDYSDYEVQITAPDNFTVWASVAADNPGEVYSQTILDRLAKAKTSTEPVNILTEAEFRKEASGTKTWKYTAKNFPDFAFAMSDHFVWDAASYKDKEGEFSIHTAYPPTSTGFKSVLATIQESLKIFHNDFPRYPFPYRNFTIFNGLKGGGMEFPGMANDQENTGAIYTRFLGREVTDFEANLGLTLHEMCHMYFPFLMGINEKKYAWMDEGHASFSSYFIPELFNQGNRDQPWLAGQRVLPMLTPSYQMEGSGMNSYTVGSRSYQALYKLLGKDMFLKCLNAYMDEWKYKHPTPYDFFFTFNRVSGQDLNWFWNNWYINWGYMDLGIRSVANDKIVIANEGGRALPFTLKITFADGTESTTEFTPVVWKNSKAYSHVMKGNKKAIKQVDLVIEFGGDADGKNNVWVKE
jgi:hypothetical protein